MFKASLRISLVVCLTSPAFATNDLEKTPKPNALSVSEVLKRAANTPLGPGDACLLRAVADLVEKEQVARTQGSTTSASESVIASKSRPAEVEDTTVLSASGAAESEPRKRLVFRLRHVPVVDVAKSLEKFLVDEQKARTTCESVADAVRAVLVPEPVSNSLLVSGCPEIVDSLTELIAQLDAAPDVVKVKVCIAELLPPLVDVNDDDDSAMARGPRMEDDGAAWLAWAANHGRLEIISQPQIMTLDNQPANIHIGSTVPYGAPTPGTDGAGGPRLKQTEVGLNVRLTPRISPEGLVVVKLDVERTTVVNKDGAAGPIIGKTNVSTTVSARDGQTVVLGGQLHRVNDRDRQLVVAVTPHVNPQKR